MKREDLTAKGLTPEQVEFVMPEYGKEFNPLKLERDSYKTQLDTAQAALEKMKGVDAAGMQTKINDLTEELKEKEREIEKIKSDYAFNDTLKEAIRTASGRNEKAITALLDLDTLKTSKNKADDIKAALDDLKKENDYLFQDTNVPRVVSATSGINTYEQTKKEQANEALRSLFGKGE